MTFLILLSMPQLTPEILRVQFSLKATFYLLSYTNPLV